jgi:conjugative transposon TraM protein
LNNSVGDVSPGVRKKELTDKLDAYRNTYKDADGSSAVNIIPVESVTGNTAQNKQRLDSIDKAMKAKFNQPNDGQMVAALNNIKRSPKIQPSPTVKEKDPMDVFRQQIAYMDSINHANDPLVKAERQKQEKESAALLAKSKTPKLDVSKAGAGDRDFNTVVPGQNKDFIMAAIDENITGYAGSRLRLKLLDDIKAGNNLIPKGSYVYALISGFTGQRVALEIKTILSKGKILPVKLDVYDLDGLPGLYVPESAFREFTKDLGTNSMHGVTLDGSSAGNQFLMSTAGKMFESASSAIADAIRKNKARMKYNSYIYLIDPDGLQKAQNNY